MGVLSPSCFRIVVGTQQGFCTFSTLDFSSSCNITQGRCIPTDSVKSGDDCSSLVHNIGTGAYIVSDKNNLAYLVG